MADTPENADNTADVVITDRDLYDQAISDAPAKPTPGTETTAPAPEDTPLLTPQQQPTPSVARDEQGRFAPRQGDQKQQPQQQQPRPEDHRVPLSDLLNARERAQRAEAEAQQMRMAWAQLQQQQAAAAQQPQPQPQTIFDDPQAYLLQNVVQPLRQEMQMQALREKDLMSREFANQQFGAQAIEQALVDLARIRQTPHGNVLYSQIMGSGHPYGTLVNWHRQARVQQQIGSDPEAWFQRRAQQLLDDPRFQAAAIERARRRASQQSQGGSGNVSLPPSLSSIAASSPRLEDQGDLSSESLYRFATK